VAFAANHTWDASTRAFIDNMVILRAPAVEAEPVDVLAGQPSAWPGAVDLTFASAPPREI
jgi:hypothetical protein